VEVDSRQVRPGDLFCALPGERVDGHSFVGRALEAGALAALVARDPGCPVPSGRQLLEVPDVREALGQLARHHRDRYAIPVIGVTGSVGKTTTKDLIASALGSTLRVLANRGNLNTDIGLPLSLFELGPEHEIVCLEMSMRGPGEVARLAALARPSSGVITNVGPAHIEWLGSLQAIATAKEELLWALPPDGSAVLNADDPIVSAMAPRHRGRLARVVTYGLDRPADVSAAGLDPASEAGARFLVTAFGTELGPFTVPLAGKHSVLNALAAVAVALLHGVNPEAIRSGLARPRLSGLRQEVTAVGGVTVVNDAYNAGPASMAASVELLVAWRARRGGRAVAVLGDMLELGGLSEAAHRDLGRALARAGIDHLIAVGPLSAVLSEAARQGGLGEDRVQHFSGQPGAGNPEAAEAALRAVRPGDTVLVKASRGMKFEEIADRLVSGLRDRAEGRAAEGRAAEDKAAEGRAAEDKAAEE
jgi:UDP-N-acetylmuramoyl-tripeptide--D-alanyl-D-alanine ligase